MNKQFKLSWLFLTGIFLFFFIFIANNPIDFSMFYLSVDEKYEKIDPYKFGIYNFIKENVEINSTVIFFHRGHYLLAKPYLYPDINCTFFKFDEIRTDNFLIKMMRSSNIQYLMIISGPHHLAERIDVFEKIEYSVQIYLLKLIG